MGYVSQRELRILLDSKDLINLVEHQLPLSLEDLKRRLQAINGSLVFTFTNIRELVAPVASDGDFLRARRWLQELEDFPHKYIAEPSIDDQELAEAAKAFASGNEYKPINPYVPRFDYTFRSAIKEQMVNYRLHDIVWDMWKVAPDVFRQPARHGDMLRAVFAGDRRLSNAKRKARLGENLAAVITRYVEQWRLKFPKQDVPALAKWVYDMPDRCPGVRLRYETFHALVNNLGDIPLDSDLLDLAQLTAIPYVEAATVDRRMLHYFGVAAKKIKRLNWNIKYSEYVFPELSALLDHFGI